MKVKDKRPFIIIGLAIIAILLWKFNSTQNKPEEDPYSTNPTTTRTATPTTTPPSPPIKGIKLRPDSCVNCNLYSIVADGRGGDSIINNGIDRVKCCPDIPEEIHKKPTPKVKKKVTDPNRPPENGEEFKANPPNINDDPSRKEQKGSIIKQVKAPRQ